GTSNSLQVISIDKDYSAKVIKTFRLGTRVNQISWGPTTSKNDPLVDQPRTVTSFEILVACSDQNLRLLGYQRSLEEEEEDDDDDDLNRSRAGTTSIKVFGQGHSGHSGRITSIAWCNVPGYSNIIASAGSDRCVLIWNIDGPDEDQSTTDDSVKVLNRSSPAPTLIGPLTFTPVSLSFHPNSSGRLMIYDSTGTIKLIDWTKPSRPIILSLFEPRTMIEKLHGTRQMDQDRIGSADWKSDEVDVFGGLSGNRWAVWDLGSTKAGNPIATGDAWGPGVVADRFRWCPTNPRLFALSSSSPNASSAGFGAIQIYYTAFPQSPRTIHLPVEINPGRKRVHDIDWQPAKRGGETGPANVTGGRGDVLCVAVGRELVWIRLGI
ncbi:WD40-repeat-containing domain protein, partial [Phakopsora pachyrhizi]